VSVSYPAASPNPQSGPGKRYDRARRLRLAEPQAIDSRGMVAGPRIAPVGRDATIALAFAPTLKSRCELNDVRACHVVLSSAATAK